ncbi:MAG: response regulator transcription factor, partial [Myxococcales bacterium]|nr:response regulator transcription factor [Myxococcales bacterium]
MRVLQLEADAGAARAMTRLFEGRAVTVHVCSTVAQAGQTLALRAYDVVLANLRLPDGSSAELCRALRARGDQTPVVVLAEAMTEAELVGAYAAGASLCLRKPIAGQELIAHVEAITRSVSPRQIPVAGAVLHVLQSRLVLPDGNAHTLSVHECRLCLELARHPGT